MCGVRRDTLAIAALQRAEEPSKRYPLTGIPTLVKDKMVGIAQCEFREIRRLGVAMLQRDGSNGGSHYDLSIVSACGNPPKAVRLLRICRGA